MQTNFENVILCKSIFIVSPFTAFMSFCFLLCIAVQRYLKICRHCTLSLKILRMVLVFTFLFSIVFCSPFGVYYGINSYEKKDNIIGSRCYRLKNPNFHVSGLAYYIAFALIIFCVVLTLFILYGIIGWTILNHTRSNKPTHLPIYRVKNKTSNVNSTSDNQIISVEIEGKRTKRKSFSKAIETKKGEGPIEKSIKKKKQHVLKNQTIDRKSSAGTMYPRAKPTTKTKVYHNQSQKRNTRVKRNITFMFIEITHVSIIKQAIVR